MDKLVIDGIAPYDGSYEFTLDGFTNRELHRIKKLTGLRAGEFEDAFSALDNDMVVALAVVILERNGQSVRDDILWDAEAGGIRLEFSTEEVDDGPPALGESPTSSGGSSLPDSESPGNGQSLTGSPLSDIGVTYAHPT